MQRMSSKINAENRLNDKPCRTFQLDSFNASKTGIQPKRSPLKPINVDNTRKLSPKTVNGQALKGTVEVSSETNDNDGAELQQNIGRSQLLKLFAALKMDNMPKEPSTELGEASLSSNQPTETIAEPLKIIDLNDFCLQRIIRLLSLQDIINVAGSCTRLQKMACVVFKLVLREHEVVIDCSQFPSYTVNARSDVLPKMFFGSDFDAFITSFGEVIKKLTITNMFPVAQRDLDRLKNDEDIEQLVTKNCRDYLCDITFKRCGTRAMSQAKPFKEVTKVSFINCAMGQKGSDFDYLFPKMRKLEMIDCDVTEVRESIVRPLPQLKCLDLYVPLDLNSWMGSSFSVKNVKAAIDLNPQIQSLGLCYWNEVAYDAKLLQYSAVNLPNLRHLRLSHIRFSDFRSEGPEEIHFTSVRKLTLTNNYSELGLLDRNLNALKFEGLQKFRLIGRFDTECLAFLARHKTINKLYFISTGQHDWNATDHDLIMFGSILPNIKKIELNGSNLTPTGLMRFITKCGSVSLVKVRHYTFSAVIRRLFIFKCNGLGWRVTYTNSTHEREIVMRRMTN